MKKKTNIKNLMLLSLYLTVGVEFRWREEGVAHVRPARETTWQNKHALQQHQLIVQSPQPICTYIRNRIEIILHRLTIYDYVELIYEKLRHKKSHATISL